VGPVFRAKSTTQACKPSAMRKVPIPHRPGKKDYVIEPENVDAKSHHRQSSRTKFSKTWDCTARMERARNLRPVARWIEAKLPKPPFASRRTPRSLDTPWAA
jgi:hypothetical protein